MKLFFDLNWILANSSTVLSASAFLLSLYVWVRQGRYEGKLAKIQLSKFNQINLFPELVSEGGKSSSSPRLRITNIGDIDAYNVELIYGAEVPIRAGECSSIFPIKKFSPNTPVSLLFQPSMASPNSFDITLRWEDINGKKYESKRTFYNNY